jgi:hypothetical protein
MSGKLWQPSQHFDLLPWSVIFHHHFKPITNHSNACGFASSEQGKSSILSDGMHIIILLP